MPLPVPLAPLVIVTQFRLSVADHAHPLVDDRVTLAALPPGTITWVVGDTE